MPGKQTGGLHSYAVLARAALLLALTTVVSCQRHFGATMHEYVAHATIKQFFDAWHSAVPWNWDIFEYNDQQPIADASGTYGPVIAIFAAPDLGTTNDVSAFSLPEGHLVAIIHVDEGTLPASYSTAGLRLGFNCLFITHTGGDDASGWAAYTTPTTAGADCPSGPGAAGRVDLPAVRRTFPEAAAPGDYPGVARIAETQTQGVAFGVRCGAGWCDAGVSDPTQLADGEHQGDASESASSRTRVPGWFDTQRLAVPVSNFLGRKHLVAKMRASVIPSTMLGTWNKAAYAGSSAGQQVARVFIRGPVASEYRDAGLRQGWNQLWLRLEDSTADHWQARIINSHGTGPWLRVNRTDHAGKPVPATARFAWEPWDEGIWVDCAIGCCEVLSQLDQ